MSTNKQTNNQSRPAPPQCALSGLRHAEVTGRAPPTVSDQNLLEFEVSLARGVHGGAIIVAVSLGPAHLRVPLGFDEQGLSRGLLQQHQCHFPTDRVPLGKRVVLVERLVSHREALHRGHRGEEGDDDEDVDERK